MKQISCFCYAHAIEMMLVMWFLFHSSTRGLGLGWTAWASLSITWEARTLFSGSLMMPANVMRLATFTPTGHFSCPATTACTRSWKCIWIGWRGCVSPVVIGLLPLGNEIHCGLVHIRIFESCLLFFPSRFCMEANHYHWNLLCGGF